MKMIQWIQQFSNPVLDWFFRIVTEFGDMIFFIVFGAVMYWVFNKKFAFKMMISFLFSALINGAIKSFTNKPRPYQEGAKPILQETQGSSMPSGHSQGIGALGSMMVFEYRRVKWVKIVFIVLMVLVPFSRMYLGQHYFEDVLVGLILGIGMGLLGLYLLSFGEDDQEDIRALFLIPVLLLLMVFIHNNQLYVASGAYIGLVVGYYFEKKYVQYDTNDMWWVHVLKVVIGLAFAFGIKEGIKPVFAFIHQGNTHLENIFDTIRYMLIALWASLGAMWVFKLLFKRNSRIDN